MRRLDFEIFDGNNPVIELTVLDLAGVAKDLTGLQEAKFEVSKLQQYMVTGDLEIKPAGSALVSHSMTGDGFVSINDAPAGRLDVEVQATDFQNRFGRHYYEVQITDGNSRKSTVLYGVVYVRKGLID
jgi:hypothetical protein